MEWVPITVAVFAGAAAAFVIQGVIRDLNPGPRAYNSLQHQRLRKSLDLLIKIAERQERALCRLTDMQSGLNRNLQAADGKLLIEPPSQESTD